MLLLLSPAKTLDYTTPADVPEPTTPRFLARSAELIALLQTRSPDDIATLMNLSPALAELNVARYAAWRRRPGSHASKPAMLAFDGDVYTGLDARSMGAADLAWAQDHVAILSGLYGVLRPLDRMQPYRLEMGTRLPNDKGRDLYAFWRDTIAAHLDARVRALRQPGDEGAPVIVNLASQEYFKAVDRQRLRARVIDCVFEDWQANGYKIISFFAKRARGAMARHVIQQRLSSPLGLRDFTADGYRFDDAASDPDRLVFRRAERLAEAA